MPLQISIWVLLAFIIWSRSMLLQGIVSVLSKNLLNNAQCTLVVFLIIFGCFVLASSVVHYKIKFYYILVICLMKYVDHKDWRQRRHNYLNIGFDIILELAMTSLLSYYIQTVIILFQFPANCSLQYSTGFSFKIFFKTVWTFKCIKLQPKVFVKFQWCPKSSCAK